MSEDVRGADVAVVGAGLAGLVAARDVIAAGSSAVVLEARDRVGGRLLNEEIGDGKAVEVGDSGSVRPRTGWPPSHRTRGSTPFRPTGWGRT